MRKVIKVPRKGTVWLLQKTKDLTEEDRRDLLGYVGQLEQSEDRLSNSIQNMFWSLSCEVKDV